VAERFSERIRRLAGDDWTDAAESLLSTALRHSSCLSEERGAGPGDSGEDNERLEFLGDAVLGMVVAEALYSLSPPLAPGAMTRLRAAAVAGPALAEVAREWRLGDELRLGKGELMQGGNANPSNLGRAMEAAIGAVYLGAGPRAAARVVMAALGDRVREQPGQVMASDTDPKSALLEYVQARWQGMAPAYDVAGRDGPDHAPRWTIRARVGAIAAEASGASLRSAEKAAARELLMMLQLPGLDGQAGRPDQRAARDCAATEREQERSLFA
jgi:ribonuclease-3